MRKAKGLFFFMFECPHCGALWALAWLRLVGKKERLVWMYVTTGCLRLAPFPTGAASARLRVVWFLPPRCTRSYHTFPLCDRGGYSTVIVAHRLSFWFSYSL